MFRCQSFLNGGGEQARDPRHGFIVDNFAAATDFLSSPVCIC
jgi:hypothetical protein